MHNYSSSFPQSQTWQLNLPNSLNTQLPELIEKKPSITRVNSLSNQLIEQTRNLSIKLKKSFVKPIPLPPLALPKNSLNLKHSKEFGLLSWKELPSEGIIITRPLKELFCHIRHLKRPSLELLARSVKTLALSIFRWHFCDRVLLLNNEAVIHSFQHRVTQENLSSLRQKHPYLLESAFFLQLKVITKPTAQLPDSSKYKAINPDAIRDYYKDMYQIEITNKTNRNTILDLFKSTYFTLSKLDLN